MESQVISNDAPSSSRAVTVSLRTGATGPGVRNAFLELHRQLVNAQGASTTVDQTRDRYLLWCDDAERQLRPLISTEDIDRPIHTPGWDHLQRVGHRLTAAAREIERMLAVLSEETAALAAALARWQHPGTLLVADTNVWMHGLESPLVTQVPVPAQTWWYGLDDLYQGPLHLCVPLLVLDELDHHKDSRAVTSQTQQVGQLARAALKVLGPVWRAQGTSSRLTEPEPHFEVRATLLPDPPAHRRMPVADDEFIARAAHLEALTGREVIVVTNDANTISRSNLAGLAWLGKRGPTRGPTPMSEA